MSHLWVGKPSFLISILILWAEDLFVSSQGCMIPHVPCTGRNPLRHISWAREFSSYERKSPHVSYYGWKIPHVSSHGQGAPESPCLISWVGSPHVSPYGLEKPHVSSNGQGVPMSHLMGGGVPMSHLVGWGALLCHLMGRESPRLI